MTRMPFFETGEKLDHYSFEWHNHIDDLIFGPKKREVTLLKDLLARYDVKSVLDVACGNGDAAILLAGMGKSVTAMDQDFARVKRVHLKSILAGVQLEVACGDMRDLSSVYKHKCNLIMCLRNSLSRLVNEADIWGTLAQMYLALEPEGLLVIQTFDYDRLFRENNYTFTEIDDYYNDLGVKVFFEEGHEKANAKFIFQVFNHYLPERKAERIAFPVRPIFQKELDMWLAELGFGKIENCGSLTDNYCTVGAWQTVTVAYRPGPSEDH